MTNTLRWLMIPAVFYLFTNAAFAQKVDRKLIYTAPSADQLPELLERRTIYLPNAYLLSMFYVDELGGYRVFLNGQDKGLHPKIAGLEPSLDMYGNSILPVTIEGQQGVEINGVQHGPFKKIKEAEISNGHILIQHYDPQAKKTYVYLDNKNVWESSSQFSNGGSVRVDEAGNLIRVESYNFSTGAAAKIFVNDSLLCSNCGIGYNQGAGNHYFFLYRSSQDKAKGLDNWQYLLDGRRYGPTSGYWVPRIDSFGNFVMPHEWGGQEFVQVNQERFGPIRNVRSVRSNTGAFGVMFKYQAPEDLKFPRHLYLNGQVLGPYDSIQLYLGSDIYYFESEGRKRLGRGGKIIFEIPDSVKLRTFRYNGKGQYMFDLSDGSVYLNGQLHRTYAELKGFGLFETGEYYVQYRKEKRELLLDLNGREFSFGAMPVAPGFYQTDGLMFSADNRHFLKYDSNCSLNYFYIDGTRFECRAGATKFYNLLSENAFAWLTIEDNQYYWHTLKLD